MDSSPPSVLSILVVKEVCLQTLPSFEMTSNMPEGQERVAVTDNVFADPSTIMGQSVSAVLATEVGGEKINGKIATDVFGKKLNSGSNPVVIKTYGVCLTAKNTLKISLTA